MFTDLFHLNLIASKLRFISLSLNLKSCTFSNTVQPRVQIFILKLELHKLALPTLQINMNVKKNKAGKVGLEKDRKTPTAGRKNEWG